MKDKNLWKALGAYVYSWKNETGLKSLDELNRRVSDLEGKPSRGDLLFDAGARAEVEKLQYRFADIESKLDTLIDHLGITFKELDLTRRHEVVKKKK